MATDHFQLSTTTILTGPEIWQPRLTIELTNFTYLRFNKAHDGKNPAALNPVDLHTASITRGDKETGCG